jgi:hypothetical protein
MANRPVIRIAKRIPAHYVGEDCLQEMIGYRGSLLMLSPEEIIYQDTHAEEKINKYLEDERRHQFPYSNIPTHYQRAPFKKFLFTNQLLDFNVPYLQISAQGIFAQHAVKDGNTGIVFLEKIMFTEQPKEKLVTREELESYFDFEDDKCFIYKGYVVGKLNFPETDTILKHYKSYASNIIRNNYASNFETDVAIDSLISNLSVSSIPSDYTFLASDEIILMIKGKGSQMELQFVDVKYMNENSYKLITKNIPINLYNLEQLRQLRVFDSKEPKIDLRLNPTVTKEEVEKAKSLILRLNK